MSYADPSLQLQQAVFTQLVNDIGVKAVVADRVYDAVQNSPVFPYVTIGDGQLLPDKADCINGSQIFLQIDAWTRTVGYPETKRITSAVLAALDDHADSITVEGFHLVVLEFQEVRYVRDPDGLTRHAIITFHALLQPV